MSVQEWPYYFGVSTRVPDFWKLAGLFFDKACELCGTNGFRMD